mmetsp:Transcript_24210/g.65600  ORF Transcript_24210/g.65600 Transcript_24210/m.65600 type:complete len:128 (-) Transcript_24210:522-905(-)
MSNAAHGVRPGGGRNPLPFSSGGGFAGMNGTRFTRYWLARAEVWPLFAAVGVGGTLMVWGLSREFANNPRYTISKSKRANPEVQFSGEEVERFRNTPLIPHAKESFNFFNMGFRPMKDLRSDVRGQQ